MKTGFTNAFVNKPLTKYYSYHGIIKPCNVQPNPDPFEDFPNTYTECVWEIWYDQYIESPGYVTIYYGTEDFYPSSDPDPCPVKFPDGKARYYFCEVTLYHRYGSGLMIIFGNDGLNCTLKTEGKTGEVWYKAWFNRINKQFNYIVLVNASRLPSRIRIWRTVCGEFNPNWPVPPA